MKKGLRAAPLVPLMVVLVLGCGAGASADAVVEQSGGIKTVTVDDFTMGWLIDGDVIEITMTAPTTGWISVGFDPSTAMKDANIIIGYVDNGEVHLRDDWGDGHISHRPDTDLGGTDDVVQVSGSQEDGSTSITFRIPMDSGDEYDKVLEEGATVKVIFAYGRNGDNSFTGMHAWAKSAELEL